jgi:hypothetical protein
VKIEIANNDDNFFRVNPKIGTPEEIVETTTEPVLEEPTPRPPKTKIPAPLNNPKGLGWFDGTSWGT